MATTSQLSTEMTVVEKMAFIVLYSPESEEMRRVV